MAVFPKGLTYINKQCMKHFIVNTKLLLIPTTQLKWRWGAVSREKHDARQHCFGYNYFNQNNYSRWYYRVKV